MHDIRNLALSGLLVLWSSTVLADGSTSFDFTFDRLSGCKTIFTNPEIRFQGVPKEARTVLLTLHQGERDLGGEEVALPASGILPPGEVHTMAPCNPDTYTYKAFVKSADGRIVAKADKSHFFPTN